MRIQHESRTGRSRRELDLTSISPVGVDRRWKKDQRSNTVDEGEMYDSRAAKPDDYWERLFSIPSEDCK